MPRFLESKLADVYRMRDNPDCDDYDPLKADFRNFLYHIFTEVVKYGKPGDIQYDIADYMQDLPISQDGIARGQVQAMRGCGKTVVACAFVCWLWYCNPAIRVGVFSSTGPRAEEFAGLVKQIIDAADLLAHLRPNQQATPMKHGKRRLKTDKNTMTCFDIAHAGPGKDPSFAAYGIYSGITGCHPDVLIPDDIEIPENSLTQLKRERLWAKMQEFESMVMEGGAILQMGTPQTEDSVYNRSKKAGYPIRKWPAELPNPSQEGSMEDVSPWLLQRLKDGEKPGSPTYTERFPLERLLEKRAKGEAYYRLQMLLDTTLSDMERYPLKLKNLIVMDQDFLQGPTNVVWGTASAIREISSPGLPGDGFYSPAWVADEFDNYSPGVMYIDPKGGGADSVGWAIARSLRGLIYVPDAGELAAGLLGTSDAVMTKLAKIAAQWGIKRVLVESNWGGSKDDSTYAKLLQPFMAKFCGPVSIETVWNTGQKERRILDDLEPLVNAHKIIVSHDVAKQENLMHQFSHLTRERGSLVHDDAIEAFWGAVKQFKSLVIIDPEVATAQQREAEMIQTAKEFEQEYRKNTGTPFGDDKWKNRKQRQAKSLIKQKRWSQA